MSLANAQSRWDDMIEAFRTGRCKKKKREGHREKVNQRKAKRKEERGMVDCRVDSPMAQAIGCKMVVEGRNFKRHPSTVTLSFRGKHWPNSRDQAQKSGDFWRLGIMLQVPSRVHGPTR